MQRGWTLFELLIVLMIIGLLSVISIPVFQGVKNKANDGATKSEVRSLISSLGGYPLASLDQMLVEEPQTSVFGDSRRTKYEIGRESNEQLTVCGISKSGRVYCMRQLPKQVAYSSGVTQTNARIALPTVDTQPIVIANKNSDRWIDDLAGSATYVEETGGGAPVAEEEPVEEDEDYGEWPNERLADSPSAVCRFDNITCSGDLDVQEGNYVRGSGIDDNGAAIVNNPLRYGASLRIRPTLEWTNELWIQGYGEAASMTGSWKIATDADGVNVTITDDEGETQKLTAPAQLVKSVWYHVAVVRDGVALKVYVNGLLAGSRNGLRPPSPALDQLVFGRQFNGDVDEWAWYPRVLPVSRIRAHARAGCQCSPQDVRQK